MVKNSSVILSADVVVEMLDNFKQMKSRLPDVVMLFHLDNNYLVFGKDAQRVMRVLEIKPVVVNLPDVDGFKYLAFDHKELDTMLPKLVGAGCKVAICEKREDPRSRNVNRSEWKH